MDAWTGLLSHIPQVSTSRLFYAVFLKRSIDLVLASLMAIVALPIVLLAALWIVMDTPGSPLFRQQRIGRGGAQFTIYKLRTMHQAEREPAITRREQPGVPHKFRGDPRVTSAGRWLRRLSIDELPQLINVIRGDMSLIGPRPELPAIVARYENWQHARHIVRPGLTGWWQVSGRSDKPMHENTELDLYYIQNLGYKLDWMILVKTARVVLRGTGAF